MATGGYLSLPRTSPFHLSREALITFEEFRDQLSWRIRGFAICEFVIEIAKSASYTISNFLIIRPCSLYPSSCCRSGFVLCFFMPASGAWIHCASPTLKFEI